MNLPTKIWLKSGRSGPTFGRHPWVFEQAIQKIEGEVKAGTTVQVLSERGQFLGWGVYNPQSKIQVRIYSWKEDSLLSDQFFKAKIFEAISFRQDLLKLKGERLCARLIFSEADELSGLIVDRYGSYLVVQITSLSMFERKELIISTLVESLMPAGIVLKIDKHLAVKEGFLGEDKVVYGEIPSAEILIEENEVRYNLNLLNSQKTGFYADQRENRKIAAQFSNGRDVLDLCTYVGGFALNAAKGGARCVVGVDSSDLAITQARKNADLNKLPQVEFVCSDVFDFLSKDSRSFDFVIVDPPRLAPSKSSKHNALRAYYKYNFEALKKLRPGGLFFTFSCSAIITSEDLESVISSVVRRSHRAGRIIHMGAQAFDHPVSTSCPETKYLKSLLLEVR